MGRAGVFLLSICRGRSYLPGSLLSAPEDSPLGLTFKVRAMVLRTITAPLGEHQRCQEHFVRNS